jgi:tyrosyl-tRNA synthetase
MGHEQQMEIVEHLASLSPNVKKNNDNFSQCIQYVVQQIHGKQHGYKSQDIHKKLFSESEFITYSQILELLKKSELKCYYCLENVQVVYEHVREQKQWSLERIDNSRGHNADNVEIACLICNVRRRTMNSEKYVATKQTKFVKSGI